jgi:hypothetical protein
MVVGPIESGRRNGPVRAKELTHLIFSPNFRFRGNPELDLAPGPGSFHLHQTGGHSQRLPWLHRASPSATLDKICGKLRAGIDIRQEETAERERRNPERAMRKLRGRAGRPGPPQGVFPDSPEVCPYLGDFPVIPSSTIHERRHTPRAVAIFSIRPSRIRRAKTGKPSFSNRVRMRR